MKFGKIHINCIEGIAPEIHIAEDALWDDYILYIQLGGDLHPVILEERSAKLYAVARIRSLKAACELGISEIPIKLENGSDSDLVAVLMNENRLEMYHTKDLLRKIKENPMRKATFLYCFEKLLLEDQAQEIEDLFGLFIRSSNGDADRIFYNGHCLGFKALIPEADGGWGHRYAEVLRAINSISTLRSLDGSVPPLLMP
jgi:hypothetical protein